MTIVRYTRLLLFVAALLALIPAVFSLQTSNAAVQNPDRDIGLFNLYDDWRGIWSDGSTLWVANNEHNEILAYNLETGIRNPDRDIDLSGGNYKPTGIWSDGATMWVADWDDTYLYAYKLSNGNREGDRDINLTGSNDGPRGIWGKDGVIYVVDKHDTYVYAYSTTDGQRQASEEFDLHGGNDSPWAIWGEGSNIWVSDLDDRMLHAYTTLTNSYSNVVRNKGLEFRLPQDNGSPRGIWSDGETMWVLDTADDNIYAMYYRDFRHQSEEIGTDEVDTPGGIWTDGDTMWVADTGRSDHGLLMAYSVSSGLRDSSKDVQLASYNTDPLSIWSDGETVWAIEDASRSSSNDFLYAYAMEPESGQEGTLAPYKSITLDSDNSNPRGIWSDGEVMWVSDSGDDKLYAYDLANRTRKSDRDIDLHSNNGDPKGIWSDGQTIWVLDRYDKHVYAYRLSNGNRRKSKEFRLVPDNNDPPGGLTSHGLRFWVSDGWDEKLYAYGKLNSIPTFSEASASFRIHYTLDGDSNVGDLPEVENADGDSLTYSLSGTDSEAFTVDSGTGEIRTMAGTTDFSGGDEFVFTASVSDGKNKLDGLDDAIDDSINVTVIVNHNADPEFTDADGTVFSVAENAAEGDTLVSLGVTDLDQDDLGYRLLPATGHPFQIADGNISLLSGQSLDFEGQDSFELTAQVRDGKNRNGVRKNSWDDSLDFEIQVTNVDEVGQLTLSSANPQVDTALVATLTDPDGVDITNDNQVNWVVERNTDSNTWTEVSDSDTSSVTFEYTPVTDDAENTLRFKATYIDGFDSENSKTVEVDTTNAVLAAPPTNLPPTFDDDAPEELTLSESTAPGANVGPPIPVTDPEGDAITFGLPNSTYKVFDVSSDGQPFLKHDAQLDYEEKKITFLWVWVRDSKGPYGEADTEWDTGHLLKVYITNADDPGTVTLSSDSPEFEVELTARLLDPDLAIHDLTWQWQTADSAESESWTDISDATADSYTPSASDVGKYLRAKASYGDGEGTGKEAIGTAANAVYRPANEAPEFDEGDSAARSLIENAPAETRVGAAVTASDAEGNALTYSLATGTDSDKFFVDPASGRLEVASGAVLDYEAAQSIAVVLQVSDNLNADHQSDSAIDDTITVTIDLVNADEPGTITLSPAAPEVGTSITATLTDPDNGISGQTWRWEKSQDGSTNWEGISGASSDTYTPETADVGMYLRAMVDYTDNVGAGKSSEGMTTDTVKADSSDTSLADLRLGNIDYNFSSSVLEYDLSVPVGKKRIRIRATPTSSSGVSVDISPPDSMSGRSGHQVDLSLGVNVITVTVSDDLGSGSTTYVARITKGNSQQNPQPQQDPPQQNPPQQNTNVNDEAGEQCMRDEMAGLIAACYVTRFAVTRVELNGDYAIDWSKWDEHHPDVSGYSIHQNQLLYKMYYDENGQVSDWSLADIYESCEFSSGNWNCEGLMRSNYFEDWDGNPTQIQQLADNADITEWASSLEEPGRLVFDKTFVRWDGDATDPNNQPVDVELRVKAIEMHLYYFMVYEGGQATDSETIMVNSSEGFDERFQ